MLQFAFVKEEDDLHSVDTGILFDIAVAFKSKESWVY